MREDKDWQRTVGACVYRLQARSFEIAGFTERCLDMHPTEFFALQSRVADVGAGRGMRTLPQEAGNSHDEGRLCDHNGPWGRSFAHHGLDCGVVLLHGG